jgi:hypothetical protein
MYTQCLLANGNKYTTSWIPSKFAEINKIVDLKENEDWDCGWTIIKTYSSVPDDHALILERQYKKCRAQTDI